MLYQEGASCEEGGQRRREPLPARTHSGTKAQKSARVSYGQVTNMTAVATGASKDVETSLLLSRGLVSEYGVTSSSRGVW